MLNLKFLSFGPSNYQVLVRVIAKILNGFTRIEPLSENLIFLSLTLSNATQSRGNLKTGLVYSSLWQRFNPFQHLMT